MGIQSAVHGSRGPVHIESATPGGDDHDAESYALGSLLMEPDTLK